MEEIPYQFTGPGVPFISLAPKLPSIPSSIAITKGSALNAQTLINNSIIILACTLASLLIGRLLVHAVGSNPRVRDMSCSMYFYLLLHLAGCITTLPYYGYIVLQWVGAARCDPLLFFVLLQMRFLYALVSTVPITILAIDRCLVITLAARWTSRWRRCLVAAGYLLTAALLSVLVALITEDGPPLSPESPSDACPSPKLGDTHATYKARMKDVLEAGDMIVSLWLLYLLRTHQSNHWAKKNSRRAQMNRLVQRLVFMEMVLNVLPIYLSITVGG